MKIITFNKVTLDIYNIADIGIKDDNPSLENADEIEVEVNLQLPLNYDDYKVNANLTGIERRKDSEIEARKEAENEALSSEISEMKNLPLAIKAQLAQAYKEIDELRTELKITPKTKEDRKSEIKTEVDKLRS